jgi:hypothetical protein
MANIPRLRAVLMHDSTWSAWIKWYIGQISQTPEVPYCYYKLVTNVIRAVNFFVIPVVYGLIYNCCQPVSFQSSNHSVSNR